VSFDGDFTVVAAGSTELEVIFVEKGLSQTVALTVVENQTDSRFPWLKLVPTDPPQMLYRGADYGQVVFDVMGPLWVATGEFTAQLDGRHIDLRGLGMEEPKFAPQAQEICEGDTCASQPYAELVGNVGGPRFRLVFPQGVPLDLEGRLEIRFMVNMELGGFPIQFEHTIETALPVTDDPAPAVTLAADYSEGVALVEGMPLDIPLTVLDPAFNNLTVDLLLDGQPWNGIGNGACTAIEFMTPDYWSLSGNNVFWDETGAVMNGDGVLWTYSHLTHRIGSATSVTLTIAPDESAQGKELLVIAYS